MRRKQSRTVGLLIAVVALTVPASAIARPIGSLTQLSGTAGCNQASGGLDGCSTTTGISEANGVVVSPDGKNAYAVSDVDNSVIEFSRNPLTGALTQLASPNDCIAQGGTACGTTSGRGLSEATGVTVSQDGKNVYVASSGSVPGLEQQASGGFCGSPSCEGAVAVFKRDLTTGVLTQLSGSAGCVSEKATLNGNFEASCASGTGLGDANSVIVSPLGDHVYVSSGDSNAIAEFKRNTGTGALTQLSTPNDCIAETGGAECGTTTAKGLGEAYSLAVTPNGATIYAANQGLSTGTPQTDGGVAAFHRNASTGALTQLSGANACVQQSNADSCSTGRGLAGASSVAVSRDGKNLYVAGTDSNAVAVFALNTSTGGLAQLAGTAGCLQASGGTDGCATATGQMGVSAVRVAPDGASVYAGASDDSALSEFARNPGTGALTQLASPNDCIAQGGTVCGTTSGRGLTGVHSLAVSPTGENIYVTGGAVATFERTDPPPTCRSTTQTLTGGRVLSVSLPCVDPGGAAISRMIVSGPRHGALGAVNQPLGTVPYTSARGFSGSDSFTFLASDNSESSNTATAVVISKPPQISGVQLAPTSFLAKKGTTLRLRLSEPATVKVLITQRVRGHKVSGHCKPKAKKGRRCSLTRKLGTLTFSGTMGANHFKLRRTNLKPGRYKLAVNAVDAAGRASKRVTIAFKIKKPGKHHATDAPASPGRGLLGEALLQLLTLR